MPGLTRRTKRGERGVALILAIGFLAVLSILGAVVLNVATRDLGEAGKYLPGQRAFYIADRAVEYAMNRDIVINLPSAGSINLVTDIAKDSAGNNIAGNPTHKAIIETDTIGTLVAGTVEDIGPSALPPAMAEIHGTEFGANFYHVTVETRALGAAKNSHVDASIVRLFKLDDETIFRTGGGG
jgi:Tfp pilus assembly protein PilX